MIDWVLKVNRLAAICGYASFVFYYMLRPAGYPGCPPLDNWFLDDFSLPLAAISMVVLTVCGLLLPQLHD